MNGVKMGGVNAALPDQHSGSYHHGDLRNALIGAATELAREGGPDAVVLREAARRTGVSAAAAYHHFANRDELGQAVKDQALELLTERMQAALGGGASGARERLRTFGAAYLGFAFDEPGLFRLTFGPRGPWPVREPDDSREHNAGPLVLLCEVLDELVALGDLPAERRPGLEYIAWAQVHGVAALCLDGPLARLDPADQQRIIDRALDAIIRGL